MIETAMRLPLAFWVALIALAGGMIWAAQRRRAGTGLPTLAVLGTVGVWYVGDLFYNDYHSYIQSFTSETLQNAWWEVVLFVASFLVLTPFVHKLYNARYLKRSSSVYRMLLTGVNDPTMQEDVEALLKGCVFLWSVLAFIAVVRLQGEMPYYLFPFLDHKADPWGRGRLGSGFDALLSLASYLQLFAAASFGIVAAVARSPRIRVVAAIGCMVAWPYYIFDRTRNTMLAAVLPGILAWTCLRVRGGWLKKGVILGAFFLLVNVWFGFVIANRSTMSITTALGDKGFDIADNVSVHHEGLNMYEELCWINTLMDDGIYQTNWGERYFAEIVSPIPRALWSAKPMIGIDYAVARGQSYSQGDAGVGASISTGMIGQGVVNFGQILGPPFAALLMSLWVAVLARLDLRGDNLTLYGLGLILTFNLGRDITLITLYTFVFGSVTVWCLRKVSRQSGGKRRGAERGGITGIQQAPHLRCG